MRDFGNGQSNSLQQLGQGLRQFPALNLRNSYEDTTSMRSQISHTSAVSKNQGWLQANPSASIVGSVANYDLKSPYGQPSPVQFEQRQHTPMEVKDMQEMQNLH